MGRRRFIPFPLKVFMTMRQSVDSPSNRAENFAVGRHEAPQEENMTMMPDWFGCKNCLFYKKHSCICAYLPVPVEKYGEAYCAQWTCRRCWQRWDLSASDAGLIDHSRCEPKIKMEEG